MNNHPSFIVRSSQNVNKKLFVCVDSGQFVTSDGWLVCWLEVDDGGVFVDIHATPSLIIIMRRQTWIDRRKDPSYKESSSIGLYRVGWFCEISDSLEHLFLLEKRSSKWN